MKAGTAVASIMAHPSSELTNGSTITNSSLLSEASTTKAVILSTDPSLNQNGQYFIQQQPLKTVNNGPALVTNNTAISKGHIIVRQKPLSTNQQTSFFAAAAFQGDKAVVERAGIKRPLTSSDNNIITKVIITKNPLSGHNQAFPVSSPMQAFTLTSSCGGGDVNSVSQQQTQSTTLTKTVVLTSQGAVSPVKSVIATIPSGDVPKFSIPFHKVPTSISKSPTKLTMIPVSGSLNKQSVNSNFTLISGGPSPMSQAGNVSLKPGSTPKVIIKQGSAPTSSSSLTFTLPTLTPQSAQSAKAPLVVHSVRTPQLAQNVQPVTVTSSRSVQQIQVPGSRFHYVRLVSSASSSDSSMLPVKPKAGETTQVVHTPTNVVPLAIAPAPATNQVQITLPFHQPNTPLAPKPASIPVSVSTQHGVHHIILPVSSSPVSSQGNTLSNLVPIQPAPAQNHIHSGTAILSAATSNIQGLQSYALVPASYVTQLQQLNKSQGNQTVSAAAAAPTPLVSKQARDYVPIASIDPEVTHYTVSRNVPNQSGPTLEATGARPRKPCNCTKSQCLKLYCDCFANGEFCQNCNCTSCANNLEHEEERSKAIKSCLDRNPQAFYPKIGKSREIEGSRQHNKGCNCKRSGCLKNYCECYEAKIMCTNFCKCIGCKNFEESPERKTLMHLATAVEVRVQQQTAAKTKLSSQISCVPVRPPVTSANGERLPFALITTDVAEATSACLLAQAEEAERMKMPPVVQERMIIEEFGRCLLQIIDSANRTRTAGALA